MLPEPPVARTEVLDADGRKKVAGILGQLDKAKLAKLPGVYRVVADGVWFEADDLTGVLDLIEKYKERFRPTA